MIDNTSDKPCDAGRPGIEPARRAHVLMAGVSTTPVCGVRDHASRLAESIGELGHEVTTLWLDGDHPPVRTFARDLLARIDEQRADAVVLHYSVFAYAWRGMPFAVPMLAARVRRAGVPVLLFAHEYAYPWGRSGWKGALRASTQRLALLPLVAASDAIVVTTNERANWMRSRRWLPRRPVACAPVFSNVPVTDESIAVAAVPGRTGVFGFGAEGLLTELVVEAVAQVRRSNPDAHLRLVGAPGPDSPAGRRLGQLADRVGCPVSFSGLVGEEQLSQELSSCDVIVHTDPAGPTSRKTTLAAALSHGRPVVAFDGPQSWQGLVDAEAVELVPADVRVTAALDALLQDGPRKAALAERAREFAAAHLSPEHTARTVLETIDQLQSRFMRQGLQPEGKLN